MAKQNPNQQSLGNRTAPRNPNSESQGGGFRGGPKRWTGRGPPPARHIPWPEIFKHHISVVEGHKKMIDMVRKHTVEGTGNYRTIMGMVERTSEMLWTSKQLSRSFLPPPNQREQVPLGVSSDSMYPGYSPADHEYGKAAEEYGRAVAEAKKRGVEIPKHPDIEYQVGQGKGTKRKSTAQGGDGEMPKDQQNGNGNGSASGSGEDTGSNKHRKMNGQDVPVQGKSEEASTEKADAPPEGENPFFVIDTNPTPVNLSTQDPSSKREVDTEADKGTKPKKSKKKHSGSLPSRLAKSEETEDISSKVDAKLKEKEAKRTQKAEKKRKRGSEKSEALPPTNTDETTTAPAAGEGKKPKTKKKKVTHSEAGE